tara:strand:+ start:361 stop:1191 length:831 start_codon:yes stop_codon:yes gene_type:complete
MDTKKKKLITKIFNEEIKDFGSQLVKDYSKDGKKLKNIENKHNNFLISSLKPEVMVYSALMRSLDSSLGNRIEEIALKIAKVSGYKVSKGVSGMISQKTINTIATLLDAYKDKKKPSVQDLQLIKDSVFSSTGTSKFHNSDYLLEKNIEDKKVLSLLELKIGGDLDNKKARSEKEAILEQYSILISKYEEELSDGSIDINIYFGTAYNKDNLDAGREKWNAGAVGDFFAYEELLIGKDFWNFICDDTSGWEFIKSEYKKNSIHIDNALQQVTSLFK